MTATAERLVDEIKSLPLPDLLEVREQVNRLADQIYSPPGKRPPQSTPEEFRAALNSLDGCCKGSNSLQRLLDERAHDRDREEAKLQAYLTRRRPTQVAA